MESVNSLMRHFPGHTLLLLCFLFYACKKDPLEGDKALLEGKWVWVQTKFYNSYTTPTTIYKYPEPDLWMNLEFIKKGRITISFNEHNHLYSEHSRRIIFDEYRLDTSDSTYYFVISIKRGNYYKGLTGRLLNRSKDTLIIDDLPMSDAQHSVTNYFVRE